MNIYFPKIIRVGAGLSLIAALLAFLVRSAEGQTPPVQRLSLGEAARLAAAQTAGVQSATARVDEAQARVRQSRAALLPQIEATPNYTSHTLNSATFGFDFPAAPGQKPLLDPNGQIIGPVKLWDLRGQVTQSLYDPTARERVKAARAGVTAASADVAIAAEQSATNAASIYVRALRNDAALQARLADSTIAAELLGIARDQLAAGVGVGLDVTRAQSQLAAARAQLIAARNDRGRVRLDLLRALNLPLDTRLELTDSLASLPLPEVADEVAAVDVAVRSRPDIRAADAQLAAAQQQLAAIRATRLPTVGVFGNDGPIGTGLNHLLNTYTYGVQLTWPIFEGGRREGLTQEQEAVARDIDIRRRDLRQQVAVDVRSAFLDIASAREQVDAARERQRLAEMEVQQARERFSAGVAGNADVVTALSTLNSARTGLIDALTAYQAARVSLARAEGTVSQLR
ncbi:MAG: outer rane efflux protein [Gemmatimonadetes bacterium]|nr:outer rane efflux protein [Gemmatimonadota bacterium]